MKRNKMFLDLSKHELKSSFNIRPIQAGDSNKLGELMYHAYKDTIDYEGESLEDSINVIKGTFEGQYGTLIPEASFMIESNGKAASAIIYTLYENMPLLTFTMTHPDYKGKGMSKDLIKTSLNALLNKGFKRCSLVVTEGNEPAESIYKKIGFKVAE